jgi:hypothetical protein
MSVWPEVTPETTLSGREGHLVCVSIDVDARYLESLLEALAQVDFPINPQIYHDAAMVYLFADGHRRTEPITLVEFPAYGARLDEVRRALEAHCFDPSSLHVTDMLAEIHTEAVPEPAPEGAPYVSRWRIKNRASAAVH